MRCFLPNKSTFESKTTAVNTNEANQNCRRVKETELYDCLSATNTCEAKTAADSSFSRPFAVEVSSWFRINLILNLAKANLDSDQ